MNIMKYSAVRTASMMYTLTRVHVKNWQAYNQIIDGLFLGMIPIKKANIFGTEFDNQHRQIQKFAAEKNPNRPLKLVISVVEPDELKGVGFANIESMVSPKDWNNLKPGVEQHSLPIADQTAGVSNDDAIATLFKIRQCILENGSVYVHCKAGRSRSAMICLIYLVVYENMTIQTAKELLIRQRKQVELNNDKLNKAAEIINEIKHRIQHEIKTHSDIKQDKMLGLITDYLNENPQPIKKLPQHLKGFFAGLCSMIAAPVAWFYGAYQFGKEIKQKYNSVTAGIAAGFAAWIIMPLGWIFGGVRIGQSVATTTTSTVQQLPTKPIINIKPVILPPATHKLAAVIVNKDSKQNDNRGLSGITRSSPLYTIVEYGDCAPLSPDSGLKLKL